MDNERRPLLSSPTPRSHTPTRFWPILLLVVSAIQILFVYVLLASPPPRFSDRISILRGHRKRCSSVFFKSQTLKLIREMPFADIFGDYMISKFENSGVILNSAGDSLYCVMDNSHAVARVGLSLGNLFNGNKPPKKDVLLHWKGQHQEYDSGFEFITYNSTSRNYIIGKESEKMDDGSYRSRSFDVTFNDTHTLVHDTCISDFRFSHENKGFEGAIAVEQNGRSLLVGLCEGNFCKSGISGRLSGHGRLVVMERENGKTCSYRTVGVLKLPEAVDFQDYSALTVWNSTRIGIASQENAAIFVGDINLDKMKITGGKIYDLPRNDDCDIKYCNLEGLYFLTRDIVVTVTDSMKGHARQHFRCREKDESIQIFQIPKA